LLTILVSVLTVLSGCDTQYETITKTVTVKDTTDTKTILWEADASGDTQFYTNDSRYMGPDEGYSYWVYGSVSETTMSSDYIVGVYKVSGSKSYYSGPIFCVQSSGNFLTVMINTERQYEIGKVIDGVYSTVIVDNTTSTDLYSGFNVMNKIKVSQTAAGTFKVVFNDAEANAVTFQDNGTTPFTGGKFGFMTTVSAEEVFPSVPVDVRFKLISPTDIGL
jgi:hypothetical protein